jgi:hypothetical protein
MMSCYGALLAQRDNLFDHFVMHSRKISTRYSLYPPAWQHLELWEE